ncbi:NADPH-dependent diflavin oxidoreductase 1 [Kwoniella bestiolae CBS 10118]|uniref:NADPH-dependent diflavin oxidoreductase 1 n=1 Tax=Kwoniella bestiolae CBS 10118 TaxID=1296100 RepID=A0A1B9G6K4_9TREE|nr:NADPH-ferrihemoprotein reductase [Kwoniella bestiolae CBS 10118]OCF26628.1 NADPH-ferrihemoprotein reductase [Kwoniella bestiolae CBS 10118]
MIPLILYASETGNAQDVSHRISRSFRAQGRKVTCQSMDTFPISSLIHVPLLILVTSTHGRGDPPPAMMDLWKALLRSNLPDDILEDVHFTLFGLGDSSYERFCYAGKILARRMEGLGANKLGEYGWGDERSPNGIEDAFIPWLQQTLDTFLPYLPVSPDYVPISSTELPPPIYSLTPIATSSKRTNGDLDIPLDGLSISSTPNGHSTSAPTRVEDTLRDEDDGLVKPDDWVWATLRKNERVTKGDWWQDVREIELEFEDDVTPYLPGSICSLQPQSSKEEVDDFLEMMDLESQADIPMRVDSLLQEQPLPQHLPPSSKPTTLRSLLTNHLDIRCSPRKSFFEWLRRLSPDEREQERLDEFIDDPDEIHTYATRPSRSIVETLADFRQTKIPLSHILEILPPLRRRQFSIASSWDAHPGNVQLLVALVEYKTNLKIPRRGLCSQWLDQLTIGTRIPIHISPPTLFLPPNPETPVILVGPGTGVAPMRAFVETRVKQGAIENTALYFGCRSKYADLYFSEELQKYGEMGVNIQIAASRDQEEKVYVQHLIKENKEEVQEWLVDRGGYVYISGSSNAMPREVREALAWCVSMEGAGTFTEEESTEYIERMFEEKRGGEESW